MVTGFSSSFDSAMMQSYHDPENGHAQASSHCQAQSSDFYQHQASNVCQPQASNFCQAQSSDYYKPQPSTSKGHSNKASRLDDLIRAHDNLDLNHPQPSKFSMAKLEQLVMSSYPDQRSAHPVVKRDKAKIEPLSSSDRNISSIDADFYNSNFNPVKRTGFNDVLMMPYENPKVDPSLDSPIPSPLIPNTDAPDLEMDSIPFDIPSGTNTI